MDRPPGETLTVPCMACGKTITFDPRRFERHESFEMSVTSKSPPFSIYVPCPHCKIVNQIGLEE